MPCGVRCAETTCTSHATANSARTSMAPCITGRSESLPIMTPTSGSALVLDIGHRSYPPIGVVGCPKPRRVARVLRTRLTDLLQIEHPVMLAGMGGVSYHRLVAAVGGAGGIGALRAAALGAGQV